MGNIKRKANPRKANPRKARLPSRPSLRRRNSNMSHTSLLVQKLRSLLGGSDGLVANESANDLDLDHHFRALAQEIVNRRSMCSPCKRGYSFSYNDLCEEKKQRLMEDDEEEERKEEGSAHEEDDSHEKEKEEGEEEEERTGEDNGHEEDFHEKEKEEDEEDVYCEGDAYCEEDTEDETGSGKEEDPETPVLFDNENEDEYDDEDRNDENPESYENISVETGEEEEDVDLDGYVFCEAEEEEKEKRIGEEEEVVEEEEEVVEEEEEGIEEEVVVEEEEVVVIQEEEVVEEDKVVVEEEEKEEDTEPAKKRCCKDREGNDTCIVVTDPSNDEENNENEDDQIQEDEADEEKDDDCIDPEVDCKFICTENDAVEEEDNVSSQEEEEEECEDDNAETIDDLYNETYFFNKKELEEICKQYLLYQQDFEIASDDEEIYFNWEDRAAEYQAEPATEFQNEEEELNDPDIQINEDVYYMGFETHHLEEASEEITEDRTRRSKRRKQGDLSKRNYGSYQHEDGVAIEENEDNRFYFQEDNTINTNCNNNGIYIEEEVSKGEREGNEEGSDGDDDEGDGEKDEDNDVDDNDDDDDDDDDDDEDDEAVLRDMNNNDDNEYDDDEYDDDEDDEDDDDKAGGEDNATDNASTGLIIPNTLPDCTDSIPDPEVYDDIESVLITPPRSPTLLSPFLGNSPVHQDVVWTSSDNMSPPAGHSNLSKCGSSDCSNVGEDAQAKCLEEIVKSLPVQQDEAMVASLASFAKDNLADYVNQFTHYFKQDKRVSPQKMKSNNEELGECSNTVIQSEEEPKHSPIAETPCSSKPCVKEQTPRIVMDKIIKEPSVEICGNSQGFPTEQPTLQEDEVDAEQATGAKENWTFMGWTVGEDGDAGKLSGDQEGHFDNQNEQAGEQFEEPSLSPVFLEPTLLDDEILPPSTPAPTKLSDDVQQQPTPYPVDNSKASPGAEPTELAENVLDGITAGQAPLNVVVKNPPRRTRSRSPQQRRKLGKQRRMWGSKDSWRSSAYPKLSSDKAERLGLTPKKRDSLSGRASPNRRKSSSSKKKAPTTEIVRGSVLSPQRTPGEKTEPMRIVVKSPSGVMKRMSTPQHQITIPPKGPQPTQGNKEAWKIVNSVRGIEKKTVSAQVQPASKKNPQSKPNSESEPAWKRVNDLSKKDLSAPKKMSNNFEKKGSASFIVGRLNETGSQQALQSNSQSNVSTFQAKADFKPNSISRGKNGSPHYRQMHETNLDLEPRLEEPTLTSNIEEMRAAKAAFSKTIVPKLINGNWHAERAIVPPRPQPTRFSAQPVQESKPWKRAEDPKQTPERSWLLKMTSSKMRTEGNMAGSGDESASDIAAHTTTVWSKSNKAPSQSDSETFDKKLTKAKEQVKTYKVQSSKDSKKPETFRSDPVVMKKKPTVKHNWQSPRPPMKLPGEKHKGLKPEKMIYKDDIKRPSKPSEYKANKSGMYLSQIKEEVVRNEGKSQAEAKAKQGWQDSFFGRLSKRRTVEETANTMEFEESVSMENSVVRRDHPGNASRPASSGSSWFSIFRTAVKDKPESNQGAKDTTKSQSSQNRALASKKDKEYVKTYKTSTAQKSPQYPPMSISVPSMDKAMAPASTSKNYQAYIGRPGRPTLLSETNYSYNNFYSLDNNNNNACGQDIMDCDNDHVVWCDCLENINNNSGMKSPSKKRRKTNKSFQNLEEASESMVSFIVSNFDDKSEINNSSVTSKPPSFYSQKDGGSAISERQPVSKTREDQVNEKSKSTSTTKKAIPELPYDLKSPEDPGNRTTIDEDMESRPTFTSIKYSTEAAPEDRWKNIYQSLDKNRKVDWDLETSFNALIVWNGIQLAVLFVFFMGLFCPCLLQSTLPCPVWSGPKMAAAVSDKQYPRDPVVWELQGSGARHSPSLLYELLILPIRFMIVLINWIIIPAISIFTALVTTMSQVLLFPLQLLSKTLSPFEQLGDYTITYPDLPLPPPPSPHAAPAPKPKPQKARSEIRATRHEDFFPADPADPADPANPADPAEPVPVNVRAPYKYKPVDEVVENEEGDMSNVHEPLQRDDDLEEKLQSMRKSGVVFFYLEFDKIKHFFPSSKQVTRWFDRLENRVTNIFRRKE